MVTFKGCSYCKIGITKNLKSRLAQISTGCPEVPTLVYSQLSNISQLCESECHKRLTKFRRNGEWFQIGKNEAIQVVKDVCSTTPASWKESGRVFAKLISSSDRADKIRIRNQKHKMAKFKSIYHGSENGFGVLIVAINSFKLDGYELIASGVAIKQVSKLLNFLSGSLEDESNVSLSGVDHKMMTYDTSSEELRLKCINLLKF